MLKLVINDSDMDARKEMFWVPWLFLTVLLFN